MSHKIDNPKLNLLKKQYSPNSNFISPFMKEGEFLEHRPLINKNYYIQNFEYLTDYHNEIITIGKGGYGKLYLAKNKKDGKEYAIKNVSKLKMKIMGVDSSVIIREIDIHIRITHPHIIKLVSFSEDRNNYYLAMEYAQKGNLYRLIQKKRGFKENEAFHYFIQVASAIHFLHINGYAHRDIKPENILIDKKGEIKLCDFGWCVNVSKGERITFCGTYEYMAPEMINDEFYDMGIDIWSLGVLLYEMLHGYSPFRAHHFPKDERNAMKEIFRNIKSNKYTIDKNISEECIDLIDKLLTNDPKKRIKINEVFLHPWVMSKEGDYFPFYHRYFNLTESNTFYNSKEVDIDTYIIKNKKIKEENPYNITYTNRFRFAKNINNNLINKEKEKEDNKKESQISESIKNKSYCFAFNKSNSNNNGIYFIKGQSGKRQDKEKNYYTQMEINRQKYNIENDNSKSNNIYSFKNNNNLIKKIYKYNESYKKVEENELKSPRMEKKEQDSKNNFIFSISSKSKKPITQKTNNANIAKINEKLKNKLLELSKYKSQDISLNNINKNERKKMDYDKKNEKGNNILTEEQDYYLKSKNDKKNFIEIPQNDSDNYIINKYNKNYFSPQNLRNKDNQDSIINKIRKISDKKIRQESPKCYNFIENDDNSHEHQLGSYALKSQISFIYNKPKKDIGSYTIKKFQRGNSSKRIKDINTTKYTDKKENHRERRAKSLKQTFAINSICFPEKSEIRTIIKEKEENNIKTNIIIDTHESNYFDNKDNDYRNSNNKGEEFKIDETSPSKKENFQRVRKKVVHIKKRPYLNIDGNIHSSQNITDKSRNENKIIKSINPKNNNQIKKSIQNKFYNTFYNSLLDNFLNHSPQKDNQHVNETNSKNLYINDDNKNATSNPLQKYITEINFQKGKGYVRKHLSIGKNLNKNIFNLKKKIDYSNHSDDCFNEKNKENNLINYCTENKVGKIYTNDDNMENNKFQYRYLKAKNTYLNLNKNSPSNRKEIIISSFN